MIDRRFSNTCATIFAAFVLVTGCEGGKFEGELSQDAECDNVTVLCTQVASSDTEKTGGGDKPEQDSEELQFLDKLEVTDVNQPVLRWEPMEASGYTYNLKIVKTEDCDSTPIQLFSFLKETQKTLDPISQDGVYYPCLFASKGEEKIASPENGSYSFTIQRAVRFIFRIQPTATVSSGKIFTDPITVEAVDQAGKVATAFNKEMTLVLAGATAATLSGTTKVVAESGSAKFPSLIVTGSEQNLSFKATATGVNFSANSYPFKVVP